MLVRTLLALPADPLARRMQRILEATGNVSVVRARSEAQVRQILQRDDIDLLVADERLAGPAPEDWVAGMRALPGAPDLMLLSGLEDAGRRATLLAAGCLAVLNTGLPDRQLEETFGTLVGRLAQNAAARLTAQPRGSEGFPEITHRSPAMAQVVAMAHRIAHSESSVLILGETGVGKERLANFIHHRSARAAGPFVTVNCGAIPEGLVESELFGHDEGAFTGAIRARRGPFEIAHRGTLFLDEVGEIPHHLQVKLLRVLEDRKVQRLGSERLEPVDVRIIAATNRDLEQDVAEGRFRADLFYRLAVVALEIPPLRDRPQDITELIQRHLTQLRSTLGRSVEGIEPDAVEALLRHRWPGNVRELGNALERAVLLAEGPRITLSDLPHAISQAGSRDAWGVTSPLLTAPDAALWKLPVRDARRVAVADFERAYLTRLLEETGGRIAETARRAGVSERSLYDLMRRADLDKRKFKFRT